MRLFKIDTTNANTDITIETAPSKHYPSVEISADDALKLLYEEVDPLHNYPITEYKLTEPNSYGRIGIEYA